MIKGHFFMSTPNQPTGEMPSLIRTAAPHTEPFNQSDMFFEPAKLYLFEYWLFLFLGIKPSPLRENTTFNLFHGSLM